MKSQKCLWTHRKCYSASLDTATFTRLGGNEQLTVDVHIIAATNRDIEKAVAEKEFREDL